MSGTTSSLANIYANPFSQVAENTAKNTTGAPQFADLIEMMDEKLIAHSSKITQENKTELAQNNTNTSDYSLLDIIDMVNPLQHIPVVSNIYRAVTGDEVRQEIRMAGNMLFGALTGPVGIAMGIGSAAVDFSTGKPVGDHVLTAIAPNLEPTIREDYSIAHYLHNPFDDDPSLNDPNKVAAEIATATAVQTPNAQFQAAEATNLYAQTANSIEQKLNKNNDKSPITVAAPIEQANITTHTVQNPQVMPLVNPETVSIHSLPNLPTPAAQQLPVETPQTSQSLQPFQSILPKSLVPETQEIKSMAQSVAYNLETVVQVTPNAAAQLASLAAGTANADELGLQMLGMTGDGASQLRAVTAKNRQLGIALGSSANISQQLDAANNRNISQQVGNKVAALYDQNAQIANTAIQRGQRSAHLSTLQPVKNNFFSNDTNEVNQSAALNNTTATQPNASTLSNTQLQQQTLQPNELGKHYHGANSNSNLSIAAAMQQALDKYQTLRRN